MKRIAQPGLFDEPSTPVVAPAPTQPTPQPTGGEWQEVPAAVFYSWSLIRQVDYCARRDFDAAVEAEERGDLEEAEWYQERGEAYVMERERLKH